MKAGGVTCTISCGSGGDGGNGGNGNGNIYGNGSSEEEE